MPRRAIYKFIFILITSCCWLSAPLHAQTDTTAADEEDGAPPPRKKYTGSHQLTIGVDLLHPVLNNLVKNRYSYEAEATYYLKNEYYAVAEGGWGGSRVDYSDLKYTTSNYFARFGFNKSILYRERPNDWDMMFIGLRVAGGGVTRSTATYQVVDSLWGNTSGQTAGRNFAAVWAEITTGMRVELIPRVFMGWNMRLKFLMNGKSFQELAPLNIGGYGRGDKNSNVDFNLYLTYALRWDRSAPTQPDTKNNAAQ